MAWILQSNYKVITKTKGNVAHKEMGKYFRIDIPGEEVVEKEKIFCATFPGPR